MNEQEQISQLSALFDDELQPPQAELVIRRAVKDAAMREHWQRYALIGACLRGEPLAGANTGNDVAARVRTRLAAEADVIAPGALAARRVAGGDGRFAGFLGRGAMGGAIAAAVAVVSIFVVRSMGPVSADNGAMIAQANVPAVSTPELVAPAAQGITIANTVAAESEPRSYTTPGANSPASNAFGNQQPLAHYVVAHSEQAASSFGFSSDLTAGATEMTQDEIKARR